MKQNSKNILILFIISAILFNCTVSKRHYRKGYHLAWHQNSKHSPKVKDSDGTKIRHERIRHLETQLKTAADVTRSEITASAEKLKISGFKGKQPKQLRLNNDSCADVIVYRDGTELTVKIVEVFNGTVKFLPCNNLNGPLRVLNGEKIFMIKYANGTKEVFKEPAKIEAEPKAKYISQPKKTNGFALASFVSLCLAQLVAFAVPEAILILIPVAVILGIIALVQISMYPETYKGKWMAMVGVITGAILSFIYITAYFIS